MSFLAPLAGAAGGLIGGLLGGSSSKAPKVNFTPPNFFGGGLTATFGNNGYTLTPGGDRLAAVGGVANTFGQQAQALGQLGSRFAPGFSNLRQAQLSALQSARTAGIGNLRDSLAQRRILGSSFAQDSLTNAQAQYDQEQANIIANTYLQELQASQTLIQQQYTAARGQFQTGLDELNLEAGIAASLTGKASSALENAAGIQAQLDAKAAAGAGSFFGNIGTQFGAGIGKMLGGAGGLFGGAGAVADPLAAAGGDAAIAGGDALASVGGDALALLAL